MSDLPAFLPQEPIPPTSCVEEENQRIKSLACLDSIEKVFDLIRTKVTYRDYAIAGEILREVKPALDDLAVGLQLMGITRDL